MRLLATILVLMVTTVRAQEPDSLHLSGLFREPLDEALRAQSMTLRDLSLRTDYAERDSFRLPLVDYAMTGALAGFDTVYVLTTQFAQADMEGTLSLGAQVISEWERRSPQAEPVCRELPELLHGLSESTRASPRDLSVSQLDSLWTWSRESFGDSENAGEASEIDIFAMRRAEHEERDRARHYLEAARRIDLKRIVNTARCAAHVATGVRGLVDSLGLNEFWRQVSMGSADQGDVSIVVGTPGDDTYTECHTLIVDPGGNDTYDFASPGSPGERPVQIVVDLGGDDTYRGSIGAGFFGTSIVLDAAGNDVYDGGDHTQGCGVFGVGIIWDEAGDDIYRARSGGQGTAFFGIGGIVDLAGNDTYRIESYGQGLGGTRGLGFIDDRGGNDTYVSGGYQTDVLRYDDHYLTMAQGVGLGMRPVASGGVGLLMDRRGNDTYVADIFGQGVAYWLGIGALVDEHGHDRYTAYQYAQGSGVHLAAGYLADRWGHDLYASNGVSQGSGHDLSVGILYDETGDDNYVTGGLSLGAGNANGISLLVDMTGDDGYLARRDDVLGYSDQRREYGMIGVALDLGGSDRYGAPWGADSTWWSHSTYGIGVDRDWSRNTSPPREPDRGRGKSAEEIAAELKHDPDSLFVQASNPVAAYRYLIEPAQDSLVARNAELWPLWAKMLSSESARERLALIQVHQTLFERGDTTNVALLVDSLASPVDRARRMAAYLLGFTFLGPDTVTSHIAPLIEMLYHADWKTRETAAISLWRERAKPAEPALIEALGDPEPDVRRAAALALARAGTSASDEALTGVLHDPDQTVRYAAQRALIAHGTATHRMLSVVSADTSIPAVHALRVIAADTLVGDEAIPTLVRALGEDRPWEVRAEAARTIGSLGLAGARDALDAALLSADHPYLRQTLAAACREVERREAVPDSDAERRAPAPRRGDR